MLNVIMNEEENCVRNDLMMMQQQQAHLRKLEKLVDLKPTCEKQLHPLECERCNGKDKQE